MRRGWLILLGILVIAGCAKAIRTGGAVKTLTLAAHGRSDYVIVVAGNAPPAENHAVKELQEHLAKISGVTLAIVADAVPPGKRAICVGESPASRAIDAMLEASKMGMEAYRIRAVDRQLLIVGGRPRGTMYGVYGFLQDTMGCRWYTQEVQKIPRASVVRIPALDIQDEPNFEYREIFFTEAFDRLWSARNRTNGIHTQLDGAVGDKIHMSHFVHTFNSLAPPEKYFDSHPEYFSFIKGKRVKTQTQLCLTNPEVLEIATATVLQWLKDCPEDNIVSVSQNDWINNCECERCKAIDEREGTPAGSLLQFVNAVAERVEKVRPDVAIDTLAYQYTQKPPKTIRPRPNVVVRLCHMSPSCDSHPLAECAQNEPYVRDLLGWNQLTQRIYIWHYVTDFAHYQVPFPNLNAIAKDIPFYHDHGVKGIFCQGAYAEGGGGDMAELRSYVLARLLWNSRLDAYAIAKEFIREVYGRAGKEIQAYYDLIHDQAKNPERHFNLYSPPEKIGITPELLLKAEALLARAEKRAESKAVLRRVRFAKIPLLYSQVYFWKKKTQEPFSRRPASEIVDEFKQLVRDYGITEVREGRRMEEFLKGL